MESLSQIHRTMLTVRIFKAKALDSDDVFSQWTWDLPTSPCKGIHRLSEGEIVVVFEPAIGDVLGERSWLVLTNEGYSYFYLYELRKRITDYFYECS